MPKDTLNRGSAEAKAHKSLRGELKAALTWLDSIDGIKGVELSREGDGRVEDSDRAAACHLKHPRQEA